jgi:hypothetical protein
MLDLSPQMTSIFEFLNGLNGARRLSPEPISADRLWDIISEPHPFITMISSRGYEVEEIRYPFDDPKSRYGRNDDLPWILVAALPRLSERPDELFDETREFVSTLPEQPAADHYRALFSWWAGKKGTTEWNERCGSSIEFLPQLAEAFPEGKFLHIMRRGEEAALSMREMPPFRLAITLVENLDPNVDVTVALENKLPPRGGDDPLRSVFEGRPPAHGFGRFWADQLSAGYRGVAKLRPEQYKEIWFEHLIERPVETMRGVAHFFELDPDLGGWIDEAAALIAGMPPSRAAALGEEERARLSEVCRTGNRLQGMTV